MLELVQPLHKALFYLLASIVCFVLHLLLGGSFMNQAIECFHFLVSGRCILSECLSECAQTFDHSSLLCCDCCFHLNPVVFIAFNEVYLLFGHLDRMHTRNTFRSVNFSRDLHVNPNPSSLLLIYNGIYSQKSLQ